MTAVDRPTPYVEIINGALEATIPSAYGLGVRAIDAIRGHAVTTVPIEGNANHFGAMYAGVVFTVGEIVGGAIAIASFDMSLYSPLVKDLHIFFQKPARTAVCAEARLSDEEIGRVSAEAAANGKADFDLTTTITDTDGVVVARTRALLQLRAHGK